MDSSQLRVFLIIYRDLQQVNLSRAFPHLHSRNMVHAQVEENEKRIGAMVWDHRVADEKRSDEVRDLSAKLAAAAAEKQALQRGFEARLAAMKSELSTAQDSVAGAAAKTEEILTWQHSSIFQTAKAKPSDHPEKQVCRLPCVLVKVDPCRLAKPLTIYDCTVRVLLKLS